MPTFRTKAIAFVVRVLAEATDIAPKPDPWEELFGGLFNTNRKSYDQKIAENIEEAAAKAVNCVKKKHTERKFNDIVKNI
jgi:hypothetical protein